MRKWGGCTAKRTVLYSNDPSIINFRTGKLRKVDRERCRKLVNYSNGRDGRRRFSGNKFLKRSQLPYCTISHTCVSTLFMISDSCCFLRQYPLGFALRYLEIFQQLANNDERRKIESPAF